MAKYYLFTIKNLSCVCLSGKLYTNPRLNRSGKQACKAAYFFEHIQAKPRKILNHRPLAALNHSIDPSPTPKEPPQNEQPKPIPGRSDCRVCKKLFDNII